MGPTQYTHWVVWKVRVATAGPKERAGLSDPPVQKTPTGWMLEEGARDKTVHLKVEKGGWRSLDPRMGWRLTDELGDEKAQSDPYWGDEISLVLFSRQHEDRKDELGGQNHLNYHALGPCRAPSKCGRDCELALK